uniref:LRRCT domain-containing protein n=1 Tax=Parastrongyloides trichosuri TaxID=131310 RepID=A0A0N4ZKL9_PARTI
MVEYSHIHHSICKHCMCDEQLATVTCAGNNLYIQTINLPKWTETLHIYNVNMKHLPHFTYNTNLRVLRINNAKMENLHPLSLISIPNLETVHFADNLLTGLPENFLQPLHNLRILNLARNKISDLGMIENILPPGLILDQFVLDGNVLLKTSLTDDGNGYASFPLTKQLHLSNTGIYGVETDKFVLNINNECINNNKCIQIPFSYEQWLLLKNLDLSWNSKLKIDALALEMMNNITSLYLDHTQLPNEFMKWMNDKSNARHIQISHSTFENKETMDDIYEEVIEWTYCGEKLEYLDISNLGISEIIFPKHCNIKYLYAQDNRIFNFQFENPSFKKIYLDNNIIQEFPTPQVGIAFDQLQILSLSHNHMRKISKHALHSFPALDFLDISKNQLYHIDMDAFPSLGLRIKFLNVSNNRLSTFIHPILPSLSVLDLSHNELTSLDPQLFVGLPILKRLILDHNSQIDMQCKLTPYNCCYKPVETIEDPIDL